MTFIIIPQNNGLGSGLAIPRLPQPFRLPSENTNWVPNNAVVITDPNAISEHAWDVTGDIQQTIPDALIDNSGYQIHIRYRGGPGSLEIRQGGPVLTVPLGALTNYGDDAGNGVANVLGNTYTLFDEFTLGPGDTEFEVKGVIYDDLYLIPKDLDTQEFAIGEFALGEFA